MERRKFPRFPVEFPVCFGGDQLVGEGTVMDLSSMGCRVRSDTPVLTGDYLGMMIRVPADLWPLAVGLAVVRWSTGREFGVEFIRMWAHHQKRLQELLQQVEKDREASAAKAV